MNTSHHQSSDAAASEQNVQTIRLAPGEARRSATIDFVRSIPAWSVSVVLHLVVLIVLAILTTDLGAKTKSVVTISTEIKPPEVHEFVQDADELTQPTTELTVAPAIRSMSPSAGTGGGPGGSGGSMTGGSGPKVNENLIPDARLKDSHRHGPDARAG